MKAGRTRSPLSIWQYVVLQNAGKEARPLGHLLEGRGGYKTDRPWVTRLVQGGYLQEIPAAPGQHRKLYRRTPAGTELAEQLRVMADRLGWEPG